MIEKKEPVAGDLDASARTLTALGLGRAEPALAGAQPPTLELRAGPRPPQPRESRFDVWIAAAVFGAALIGLGVYFVVR
jgi:hypothetical protein